MADDLPPSCLGLRTRAPKMALGQGDFRAVFRNLGTQEKPTGRTWSRPVARTSAAGRARAPKQAWEEETWQAPQTPGPQKRSKGVPQSSPGPGSSHPSCQGRLKHLQGMTPGTHGLCSPPALSAGILAVWCLKGAFAHGSLPELPSRHPFPLLGAEECRKPCKTSAALWPSSLPPHPRRILPRVHTVAAQDRETPCWPKCCRVV